MHSRELYDLLSDIPADASVSATTYLIPHLSRRRALVRFPNGVRVNTDDREEISVDYVAADLWRLERYQVAFSRDRAILRTSIAAIDRLLDSGKYGLARFTNGNLLLKLEEKSPPETLADWQSYRQQVLNEIEQAPQSSG